MNYSELTEVKPYPAYKTSQIPWIGEIPEHWEVSHLRYFCECLDGRRIPLSAENRGDKQGNIPYWGANSVIDHINGWIFDEPLVLVGEDGAPFTDTTRSVAFFVNEKVWVNNHIHVLRCSKELRPEFLVHILNSVDYKDFISGSTRDKLTQQRLLDIPIQLAPPTEQAAIVRFLDHADEQIQHYIAGKKRFIALLEEERQALVHQAVTRGLDPSVRRKDSGVEWLGDVPEHWEMRRLGQCTSVSGGATPSMEVNRFWGGSVPWVTPKDMKKDVISDSSMKVTDAAIHETSLQLVEPPVVLMVVRGMILARRVPIAYTTTPVTINQDMKALRTLRGTDAIFLAYSLNSVQEAFKPLIDEAGHGTRRLPTERWRELPITMPPPSEQRAIIEYLDNTKAEINAAIDRSRRQIDLMNEYRTRLIADVVTGQLDVREAAAQLPAAP